MQELNIVELIEKNPISKLSNAYNSKLINKIQDNFTGFEQQLFVSSFYCYLNYDKNIDYVFILREPYIANRKRIYENYAGMFPTFESFSQVMDQCTENYECLVINNNSKSNKLHDQVFWYKADNHNDFRLGSKEFWDLSKGFNSDDEEEKYDPANVKKRGQGPKISVKKTKW